MSSEVSERRLRNGEAELSLCDGTFSSQRNVKSRANRLSAEDILISFLHRPSMRAFVPPSLASSPHVAPSHSPSRTFNIYERFALVEEEEEVVAVVWAYFSCYYSSAFASRGPFLRRLTGGPKLAKGSRLVARQRLSTFRFPNCVVNTGTFVRIALTTQLSDM